MDEIIKMNIDVALLIWPDANIHHPKIVGGTDLHYSCFVDQKLNSFWIKADFCLDFRKHLGK